MVKTYPLDLRDVVESSVQNEIIRHLRKWLKFKNIQFEINKTSGDHELVKHHKYRIYTLRYDGELVLRVFQEDFEGKMFRFKVYYGENNEK